MTTTTKGYSTKSNCVRAAKAALGRNAVLGVDFTIDKGEREFFWRRKEPVQEPKAKAPRAPRSREPRKFAGCKGEKPIGHQPATIAVIKMLRKGATIEEICAARNCQPHSARALLSRIRAERDVPTEVRGRRKVYFIREAAPTEPEDDVAETCGGIVECGAVAA